MRILASPTCIPRPRPPASGIFVQQQVEGLRSVGMQVHVLFIDRRREGAMTYYRMARGFRSALAEFNS